MSNKMPRRSETVLLQEFVALCWIPAASTAPVLCVHLSKKSCSLCQNASHLLQDCLKFLPNRQAFNQVKEPKLLEEINNNALAELKKRAESETRPGQDVFLEADMTAEGAVGDIQAVGLGPNKNLKERAFWLAMSATILVQHPDECHKIYRRYQSWSAAVQSLVQEALYLLKEWTPVEAPRSLSLAENGQRFIICSNEPDFLHGRCTTAKSYSAIRQDVQEYLRKQTTLLVDFQGAVGHTGETCFAVLKPTDVLEWGPTWVARAKHTPALYGDGISPKSAVNILPVFILNMRCKANRDFLGQLLSDENILKVCFSLKGEMEALMDQDLVNVLDIARVFCPDDQKVSPSDCLARLRCVPGATSESVPQPAENSKEAAASRNVLDMEALISFGSPRRSYNEAWTNTLAMICEAKETPQRETKSTKSAALPAPPSLCFAINGRWFIIVSDLADFVQGRCTTPENDKAVAWVRPYLKEQKSLLMDFQGEMMGHAGEIYFAVIRPIPWNTGLHPEQHAMTRTILKMTRTESDGQVDSAASTLDQADVADVPGPRFVGDAPPAWHAAKCGGFILDMKSKANVELVKDLLEDETVRKVFWGSKDILEGLLHQEHPIEIKANVKNMADARNADQRSMSLFEAMERLKHPLQMSSLGDCRTSYDKVAPNIHSMDLTEWTDEDWQRLQLLLKPPEWDSFHAENDRVFRRPFSQEFLRHGAAEAIALEVMMLHRPLQFISTEEVRQEQITRNLIQSMQEDSFGIETLLRLRTQFLEHESMKRQGACNLDTHAKAVAVRYFRHFAKIHFVSSAWKDLTKGRGFEEHMELLRQLKKWIHLELPEPGQPMPFKGDYIDEIICKCLQDIDFLRVKENQNSFRRFFHGDSALFPHGISACRFKEVARLEKWAAHVQARSDHTLRQDTAAFHLRQELADPKEHFQRSSYYFHLQFPSMDSIRTSYPGGWWGLKKAVWKSTSAETQKRALQAIAWIFFGQSPEVEQSWTRFHETWAIVAWDVRKLSKVPAPTKLKSIYWFDSANMVFRRGHPDVAGPPCPQSDPLFGDHVQMNIIHGEQREQRPLLRVTYEYVKVTIEQVAWDCGLTAYVAEYMCDEKAFRLKRGTWEGFKQTIGSLVSSGFPTIEIRLRGVQVSIWNSGSFVESMPLVPLLTHVDELSPTEEYVALGSAVKALADQNNLHPCLWGYPQATKLIQLTQENIRTFFSACWKNTICENMVLPVHLQEAFVWFDSWCQKLQLVCLAEDVVFDAIGKLLQDPASGNIRKAIFFSGNRPFDFNRDHVGDLLRATTANCECFGPLHFQLHLIP